MDHNYKDKITSCLLGTAVGDALGLPFEGLSPHRRQRMFGPVDGYRLMLGRGMVSDDTEHACMTAQSLIEAREDRARFARGLARRLRWWVLMIPAGVGFATLRACLKLWAGFPPTRSGVVSAGNGPAMRSPILGITFGIDHEPLWTFVESSTQVTHRDRKAVCGAYAAALATAWAASDKEPESFVDALNTRLEDEPEAAVLIDRLQSAARSAAAGEPSTAFAESLGLSKGVSGFIYDTVPVAIHGWLRHPDDFAQAVSGVIECGGDADSTGALAGAIVGARVGADGIPDQFLDGLVEWPRTVTWMRNLADVLAQSVEAQCETPGLNPLAVLTRNIVFAAIVLAHGFRRLAPPYS